VCDDVRVGAMWWGVLKRWESVNFLIGLKVLGGL
jgi:hypothetical protein